MYELREVYISPGKNKISAQEKEGYKKIKVRLFPNECSEYMLVGITFPYRSGLVLEKKNIQL